MAACSAADTVRTMLTRPVRRRRRSRRPMTADSRGVRGRRYQRRKGYVLECFMMLQSYNTKYPLGL